MSLGEKNSNWGIFLFIAAIIIAIIVFSSARFESLPFSFDSNSRTDVLTPLPLFTFNQGGGASVRNVDINHDAFERVSVFFCPSDGCARKLIEKIRGANSRIDIAIYSLTLDSISEAIVEAKKRGVEVRIIFDYDQSHNDASDDELLSRVGVDVRMRNGSGYMHNKYAVIDSNFVATGSFNYSNNADTRNEENLVFIQSEAVAKAFEADFNFIWEKSEK